MWALQKRDGGEPVPHQEMPPTSSLEARLQQLKNIHQKENSGENYSVYSQWLQRGHVNSLYFSAIMEHTVRVCYSGTLEFGRYNG